MELTGWFVLVPMAVGSLVSGTLLALGSRWGLFRYYWVIFALVLTLVATLVLVLHMPSVSAGAAVARSSGPDDLQSLGGDLLHPAAGLVLLLTILVLNVYKPPGLTPYGWRAQNRQPSSAGPLH
jgi:hypothetical protein